MDQVASTNATVTAEIIARIDDLNARAWEIHIMLPKRGLEFIPFTQNEFEIKSGDVIYTLTDGLPDQFGGAKEKNYVQRAERIISFNGL